MPSISLVAPTLPAEPKAIAAPVTPRQVTPIRLTSFLPRSHSKIVFVLVVGCYCIVVGSFMSLWTRLAGLPSPPRAFYLRGDAPEVLSLVIFSPLVESLMVAGVFELVRRLRAPDWAQVVSSALFISVLHYWPWWPHALIVLPSFLIQTASYLYWRKASWQEAYWVVVGIHAFNNMFPALSAVGHAMHHV